MGNGKKIILFGAGQFGKKALSYYGRDQVYCFADNNENLVGSTVCEVPVIAFHQLKEIYEDYQIVISVNEINSLVIAAQLEDAGIRNYEIFLKILAGKIERSDPEITIQNCDAQKIEGKNKVLMIAYCFPPLSGSGVFRSIKFAKYLPQFGWHPTVIAADSPQPGWNYRDDSLLKEIPESVPVIRVPDSISSFQEGFTPELEKQLLEFLKNVFQDYEEVHSLYSSFLKSRTGRANLLTFPCSALTWAYRTIQYIETNMNIRKFSVIYTTSSPYSAHLVGYYFKRKYGIRWVADYRDPWTGDPTQTIDLTQPRNTLLWHLEKILLERADYSITVSEGLVKDYIDRFGMDKGKIVSITNGYDETDFTGLRLPVEPSKQFVINYSGLLHVNRSIDAVLEALNQLIKEEKIDPNSVRLRIVGDSKQYDPKTVAKRFGLENIISETGYVSHHEALQSNIDSNLLLLVVGDEEKYKVTYTGKIFDYLRSGRPVLALGPKNGVVDWILCETGHGKTFRSTQIFEIKGMILEEYRRWEKKKSVRLFHSPQIDRFERKALTEKLAKILECVKNNQ